MARSHIPGLDGFRAVAIAWVFLTHLWTYPANTPFVNAVAGAGWGAVDMFFVLSGFLITRILFNDAERPDYYRRFYTRRVRRILPVYYLLLAVVFIGFPLLSHSDGLLAARHDWLWYIGFLSNVLLARVGWQVFVLDISWSLAIEEQFYLAWPAIVRKFGRSGLTILCIALVVSLPFVRAELYTSGLVGARWLDLFTLFRLDSIALGALLAAHEDKLPRFTPAWTVALVGVVTVSLWRIQSGDLARSGLGAAWYGHSLIAVGSAILILGSLTRDSWIARALSVRRLQAFGKVSYGLYLYHAVVLAVVGTGLGAFGLSINHLVTSPVVSGVLQVALITAVAYGTAWASFVFYETPLLQSKPRAQGSTATAPLLDPGVVSAVGS